MSRTTVDAATGCLLVGGKAVFPIGLSDPPPRDARAPSGAAAWEEIAKAGVNFCRHFVVWREAVAAEQLLEVERALAAAQSHGLQLWLALHVLPFPPWQLPELVWHR